MLNLMKYEFFRRKKLLITIFIIFVFLEFSVWLGMKLGGGWYMMSLLSFVLMVIGGFAFPFLDTVINYFSDFKKRNGYMLFLTPENGYSILGAKMLFLLIEFIIMATLVVCAVSIDYNLLKEIMPDTVDRIFGGMFEPLKLVMGIDKVTFWTFLPMIGALILQYTTNAMIAVFSITIAKTLLSSKDFNWLLALVFYIAIYMGIQTLNGLVLAAFGLVKDTINLTEADNFDAVNIKKYIYIGYGVYAALICTLFPISGNLLNKRTDL